MQNNTFVVFIMETNKINDINFYNLISTTNGTKFGDNGLAISIVSTCRLHKGNAQQYCEDQTSYHYMAWDNH